MRSAIVTGQDALIGLLLGAEPVHYDKSEHVSKSRHMRHASAASHMLAWECRLTEPRDEVTLGNSALTSRPRDAPVQPEPICSHTQLLLLSHLARTLHTLHVASVMRVPFFKMRSDLLQATTALPVLVPRARVTEGDAFVRCCESELVRANVGGPMPRVSADTRQGAILRSGMQQRENTT